MRISSLILLSIGVAAAIAACGGSGDETFSPPVGRIAFTSDRDGNREIYVMSADGTGQTNLTSDPADDFEPSWSPDGTELAFQSFRGGPPNIFVAGDGGSEVMQLTDTPAVEGRLRWSPDGSRVVFYSFRSEGRGLLWVANATGSDATAPLDGIHPAGPEVQCAGGFPGGWFPDGERILFRGSHAAGHALQICAINADGSDLEVIFSEDNTDAIFPALSPGGERIAFTFNSEDVFDIYVINADGGNLQQVTDDPALDINPAWSPDGEWIAFASDRDGDMEIYIVRPDGRGLRQLTDNDFVDIEPAWVPR